MSRFGLWASPFRPFYFAGSIYAVVLAVIWLGAASAGWSPALTGLSLRQWHAHEMLFGFATAIIVGIVLTALPSWAGTEEITGPRLAGLVALWICGRLAVAAANLLPPLLPALLDCLLFPALIVLLTPQLLAVRNRLYLLLLPILAALLAANLAFHAGIATQRTGLTETGLRLAVHAIIVLYVLKGGVLAPIFTGNALRERGLGEARPFNRPLEIAAVGAVLLFATLDLAAAPPAATGVAALACCLVHAWRTLRWQGWLVADVPLLLVMHLGFAWLVLAFALRAAADLGGIVSPTAWIHAFTVGSLGMMMLGLMTRVSLRHTGRPLTVPALLKFAFLLVSAAALLRLGVASAATDPWLAGVSTILWAAAFALYFAAFARILLAPSLARSTP